MALGVEYTNNVVYQARGEAPFLFDDVRKQGCAVESFMYTSACIYTYGSERGLDSIYAILMIFYE